MDLTYLEGRPFIPGRQHCLTVVTDFYDEVMGLKIRRYACPEDWPYHAGFDLLMEGVLAEGFEPVSGGLNTCRFGYLLVMDMYHLGSPNHLAVYVGDNKILHQAHNGESAIETIRPALRRLMRGMYQPPNYERWCESRSGLLLETLPLYQQHRLLKLQEQEPGNE